jgi:hypothetical protein
MAKITTAAPRENTTVPNQEQWNISFHTRRLPIRVNTEQPNATSSVISG